MNKSLLSLACLCIGTIAYGQNTATLKLDDTENIKIDKHIYGHFAEHLGRNIYDGFYVGDDNTEIPNTDGVRDDIIEALKTLKVPNLRWPGGCFADTYQWKDGIGPKEDRPLLVNTWWGGVTEDNSFGTHDFLNMCERIGAEPYLAGNIGSGSVQDLMDWVQYVNFDGDSEMSNLRRENGREEPWNVKFWGVGNEAWGCGGNMTPEYYSNEFRKYATFMAGWTNDEGLYRIASGANSEEYEWTETLMINIPSNLMSGVALHHYSVINWAEKGPASTFSEEQYYQTMESALKMDEIVTKHSAIMDEHDPEKKVALIVDEWGGWYEVEPETNPGFLYQQNTMRDAMIAGVTLNIFHKHAERVRMANLAQTVNVLQAVILTEGEKMLLTPTYHVMEMYNVHQDATLIPMELKSNDYKTDGGSLKAVSGSASRDTEGKTHVSLVNIDPNNKQEITVNLEGGNLKNVNGRILTSENLTDHNNFEETEKVMPKELKDAKIRRNSMTVTLPPLSVVVLELN